MSPGSQIDQLFGRFPDATPEDVADSVWLVALGVIREPAVTAPPPSKPAQDSESKRPEKDSTTSTTPQGKGTESTPGSQRDPGTQTKPSSKEASPDPTRADLLARANDPQAQAAGSTAPRRSGEALRVPGGSPLPGAARIARALRPFRRRVPSRHLQTLDIDATVQQIASREIWHPVLRPSRARWFEIALVAEWSNSMALWTDTVRAFRRVLERLGGFRDVRLWWVEKPPAGPVVLRSKPGSSPRSPRELVAPDGRRLVLFATDCLSVGWRQDAFGPLLNELGRRQPVAILQMLPRTWWGRTALAHADPVFVGSKCPGTPNQALSHEPADPLASTSNRSSDSTIGRQRLVPIPILTSEPELVAEWARLVCNGLKPSLPGVTFAAIPRAETAPETAGAAAASVAKPSTPTAEQRWKRFKALASPTAIRLARLLAASHLRLPIVRLVQAALLPESDQTHLAEVFLGGIVRRVSPPDVVDPDRVQYAFQDGVAERLRTNTPLDQMFDVHSLVSKYIENRYGAALHLEAILRTGEAPEVGADFEERSEFASVTADVLRRFGARYAGAASQIAPAPQKPTTAKPPENPETTTGNATTGDAQQSGAAGETNKSNDPSHRGDDLLERVEAQLAALEGARILWVDDNPQGNARYLEELSGAGAEVTTRTDSDSALEALRQSPYDAIISDLTRGGDEWAGLRFLEQVRSIDVAIPFVIFASRVRLGMPEFEEKGILVASNNFDIIRRALAEAIRGRRRPDPQALFSDNVRDELRQFLREHNIYRRFSAEDNDADELLRPEPAKYQWELLWTELWRQSASDTEGWAKALEFVRIAASAQSVVVCSISGKLLEEVARHPETASSKRTSTPLAGRQLEAATNGTATWQGPRRLQTVLAIAIPRESENEAGPAGLLQIERASRRAFSPALTAWLRQLAGSLARRLPPSPVEEPEDASVHTIRIAGILSALEELDASSRTAILVRATYRHFQSIPTWNESSSELQEARRYVERAEAASMTREADGSFLPDREAIQMEASTRLAAAAAGPPPETQLEIHTAVVLAAAAVTAAFFPQFQNRWHRESVEKFLVARTRDGVLTSFWLTTLEMDVASAREQASRPAEV